MYFDFPKSYAIFLKIQNMTLILSSIKTTLENHFIKKIQNWKRNEKKKSDIIVLDDKKK
jgi:hypothetical protein